MIDGKKVLAIIPARGGSKSVPRKNIKLLGDHPLIAWTINEAKKSAYIDRLIVSTDDEEIAEVARKYDCEVPFLRPAELAQDNTPGIDPVLHALMMIPGYDYVMLLQPTSPLRKVNDIDGCLEKCIHEKANSIVSVSLVDKSPFWMYSMTERSLLEPVMAHKTPYTRRQDIPTIYSLNGAVYVAQSEWLQSTQTFLTQETIGFIMPKERSVDVDTPLDFLIVESLLMRELF
ncbi:acylneuraminate cytidylyltransferase family protein [Brevibacillus centrosporus]|uniref:acylneuraminate cytidylyltransferase family protein n=1 Tax=Brevibacillus centrosporus TaxID=54910 RepID=UPI00380B835B